VLPSSILIVDDEPLLRWTLSEKCREAGYAPFEASSIEEAQPILRESPPKVLLLDLHLPDGGGLDLLKDLSQSGDFPIVIMMTGAPQIDDVKSALKLGAYDFISKPINFDELNVTIQNALEADHLRSEVETLRNEVRRQSGHREIVAASPKMAALLDFVAKVAASAATTILIQGESGTGKELVAKAVHNGSSRRDHPFVAINCSAIPETLMESELFGYEKGAFTDARSLKRGLFEVAGGGTLFLDEIGEMPAPLQAKLLRVLEDQIVRRLGGIRDIQTDVRVLAASNRDLERAVRNGQFRQDLFYRLAIISVFLPPLRDRMEDVLPLVEFYIDHYNHKFRKSVAGITPEASDLFLSYDWPGNVRELRNAVERAMILEEEPLLGASCLPFALTTTSSGVSAFEFISSPSESAPEPQFQSPGNGRSLPPLSIPKGGTSLEAVERALVMIALQQSGENQSLAARLLDISRDALRYKMKKFGLLQPDHHPAATS
jgi:two-component system response regulator AtoC